MSNKLHLEGQIKAAKLGKCWMYKNTGKAEPLLHNAAPGWLLPTSNKDFSSQKKSLFALDLAFLPPKMPSQQFPESSEVLLPAPKATRRTRSGPGGSVGVF